MYVNGFKDFVSKVECVGIQINGWLVLIIVSGNGIGPYKHAPSWHAYI